MYNKESEWIFLYAAIYATKKSNAQNAQMHNEICP